MDSLAQMPLLLAHGLQLTTSDVPLPLSAFYIAAAVILIASFGLLTFAWRRPRWHAVGAPDVSAAELPPETRSAGKVTALIERACAVLLLSVIVLAVTSELMIDANAPGVRLMPVALFATWWLGLVPVTLVLGNVWTRANPIGLLARLGGIPADGRHEIPKRMGVWPAMLGLLAFAWVELVLHASDMAAPPTLGQIVIIYCAASIAAMSAYGVRPWLRCGGDAFTTYATLLASMSIWAPPTHRRRRWRLRAPLIGALNVRPVPGLSALICTMIGTVSYDGLSNTGWWRARVGTAVANLARDGVSADVSRLLFGTFGLVAMVLLVWGSFETAAWASARIGRLRSASDMTPVRIAAEFAPTLLPIALAYLVAHYFAFFMAHLALLPTVIRHPLSASVIVSNDPVVSATSVWWVQVGSIVIGHVASLLLAHDRALSLAPTPRRAVWSQLPMLALMVLYTVGGLYFLSDGLS